MRTATKGNPGTTTAPASAYSPALATMLARRDALRNELARLARAIVLESNRLRMRDVREAAKSARSCRDCGDPAEGVRCAGCAADHSRVESERQKAKRRAA